MQNLPGVEGNIPDIIAPIYQMNTPALTIKDLFRLAFSAPVVWLAETAGEHPRLNWVVTGVEEAQQGDILILSTVANAARNLTRARELGTAAVIFLGDESPSEKVLPEGLTVVGLPGQNNAQTVQKLLLTALINQRVALAEQGVRIHVQLSQIEAEGQGIAGLVNAMAAISGRGVVVQDKRLSILASQAPGELKHTWNKILASLSGLESLPESLRDRKLAALHAATVEQELDEGFSRRVAPIIVGGMARGYLSLIGTSEVLDALDSLVVEQGALVCAVEMSRTKAVREAEKRLKGDLLNALLQENLSPQDAQLWAQNMDLDLSEAHVALRFAWLGADPPSRRRLETLISGEVTRLGLKVIVSPMGSEIVCFCQVPRGVRPPDPAIRFAQAVLDQAGREYGEARVLCGLGTPTNGIDEWRSSFRQAGQALELSRRFREQKPLYFQDLSVYRLLIQLENSPELIAFQEEMLGALLASEGARELIHTLQVYFEHNGNLSQAAEALFVHRNTLIYRMDRIAALTGAALDDPETRLAMQLALHIYRMMEKTGA
ncbi:MAG TPA: helix-turn-helix domain-containing protein [Anaerolineales bacterium]|nr:helix-turn-helix domain-containing protein [Anaerolineales bacterium]